MPKLIDKLNVPVYARGTPVIDAAMREATPLRTVNLVNCFFVDKRPNAPLRRFGETEDDHTPVEIYLGAVTSDAWLAIVIDALPKAE